MSKKKIAIWGGIIIGGVILLLFLANFYVKQKLQQELDNRLASSAYQHLSVNIFSNNFSIKDVEINQERFAINAEEIRAGGLSYYNYLFNDKIEIDELELVSPKVRIFQKDSSEKNEKSQRELLIKKVSIKDGSLSKMSSDTAEASFYTRIPSAVVQDVKSGMKISDLKNYRLQLDSVFLKMNSEHYIDLENFSAENGKIDISDFRIQSFFPKNKFDQIIPYEKDWISLDVKKISLDSLNIEMRNDSLYLRNPEMIVSEAFLNIYRNKTLPDDPSVKPLYSKMLREAPIYLNFETVLVENSEILYEEQAKAEDGPAMVRFADVNGEINNLHNLRELESQPQITANADFMRGTPVNIEWSFPVFNPQDKFEISGSFGRLEGEALDPFLVPSLNARARGVVNDIYFNFYGNDDIMQGDFRINYDEFKIELLSKDEEKKGFLSSLANLFVDNEQEPDEGGGQNVKVERTKNRSFWNFAWKGLREGLIDAVGQL